MSELSTSRLRVVTPASVEPMTLAEAKTFLRIDHDADDALILRAIAAVREAAEQYLSYACITQTLEYNIDYPTHCTIRLPRGPITAMVSVTSTDGNGTDTVWAATNYRASSDGFSVLLKNQPNASVLTIRYTAGLADTAAGLPALLRQGMLYHLAVAVESRDGAMGIPAMAEQCYHPFRRVSL